MIIAALNETFGIYNYTGIAKPIARPFLESHFQSLVACRTPYLTGSNGSNASQLANAINCGNGLSNGLPSGVSHHPHPHSHPLGLHFATSFPWAAAARGKPRRGMMRRAVFSDAQRQGLEKRFQIQKYISKPDRKKLAEKLGLKDSQTKRSLIASEK
ncbi:unnamed protein product [Medioppia subpectinata]|uniref:Homeobox domain-containing protein n=1 Tax=Medioppia subpectinata TaxID=1979941 RepID=A0A7R9KKU2_9ACAR|nr:unnamed protein product [Medioppia subpectinata]CAG2104113.1 unnamed protein product [Medioppia subpectinata]